MPSREELGIVVFSAGCAALATLLLLPFGLALAWVLARRSWRGKAIVETLVTLPLVLPPVATGLILLRIIGRRGPVGALLDSALDVDVAFTWAAVVIAMAVMSLPLLVRSARTSFETVDRRLEDVALTLGASRLRVLGTITLPLASRGIAAGVLLAFARALGEFGATMMVAGNIPGRTATIATSIFHSVSLGDDAAAARLIVASLVLAFGATAGSEVLARRQAERR